VPLGWFVKPVGATTINGEIMPSITLKDLLDAGVHFGHRTRLWNPKMKPYIYSEKNGVHIIDLRRTARCLLSALKFVSSEAALGKTVLFVGTKRSATDVISEEAVRSGMYYVNHRWLGGTLTNFKTIRASVDRLIQMEKDVNDGRLENRTKKERLEHSRQITKMERSFGGIKEMKKTPDIIFVIDPKRENIAIKEANRLNIPVVALCDTNCDPEGIDFIIPGNDDAIKSIRLFTSVIADSIMEGQQFSRSRGSKGREDNISADAE
jgi:small subunit ribosomal protein S2